jgi:outer membrane protein TolC
MLPLRTLHLLLLLLLGTIGPAAAQTLSLEDCLVLARRQNLEYLSAQQALDLGYNSLERARAPFQFRADASVTLPSYQETRDTFASEALLTRFREENTTFQYLGSFSLSQRFPHLGRLSATTNGRRYDFSSNRREDYLEFTGDMNVNYSQDLLGQPQEEVALRQAELGLTNARLSFQSRQFSLEYDVTNGYYGLVRSLRQLDIEEQQRNQSKASLDLAQRKFEIGLIPEVQALRLQVAQLEAEASYAQAQTNIERRRDQLRVLLGLDLNAPLEVVDQVEYEKFPVSMERALAAALRQRTDLREAEIREQINRLELQSTRRQNGPTATFNASLGLNGRGPEIGDVSGNLERNLWGLNIEVRMPVVDGGTRRAALRQAQIALEQSRLSRELRNQQVMREVREAVRNLKEAQRQIELRRAALKVAERTYAVEQARFEQGMTDSQNLLIAQTDLTRSRTNALAAVIDYQLQLQQLRLATMADLTQLAEEEAP